MEIEKQLKECFKVAKKQEEKGIKHKGLLIVQSDKEESKEYIEKAKQELKLCELYKNGGFDYKLPEEWFYTLYYCGLAILSKMGIESRSQKYTALLLEYLKSMSGINVASKATKTNTNLCSILERKSKIKNKVMAR